MDMNVHDNAWTYVSYDQVWRLSCANYVASSWLLRLYSQSQLGPTGSITGAMRTDEGEITTITTWCLGFPVMGCNWYRRIHWRLVCGITRLQVGPAELIRQILSGTIFPRMF